MDSPEIRKILNLNKTWTFGGDADRYVRNGYGKERWDNKIVQKYQGNYREDCLHDYGNYNWGQICFEGKIYSNNINGYGIMSYPDGSFFEGLYKENERFGPGVLTYPDTTQDVGLWIGHQLIRLALNLTEGYVPKIAKTYEAKAYLNKYKKLIPIAREKSAPELLIEEMTSQESELDMQKFCNRYIKNPGSYFFDLIGFDEAYFPDMKVPVIKSFESTEPVLEPEVVTDLLSWNNEKDQMELRKYIFDHRNFEHGLSYEVHYVLGDRSQFGYRGSQETICNKLFSSICNHDNKAIASIRTHDLNPDISDSLGNTLVHCAVTHDNLQALRGLLDLGANLDRMNDECLTPLVICLLRFLETKEHVTDWEKAFLGPLKESTDRADFLLDISCKVVHLPAKKKKEKIKRERPQKQQKSEKKGKKSKKKSPDTSPRISEVVGVQENITEIKLYNIFQTLSTLLKYRADPNIGEVPLPPIFLALFTLDEAVILKLLKHGAKSNARTSHDDGFLTPLHVIASMKPTVELIKFVRILIYHGADPNSRANILHWAEEKVKLSIDETCPDEGKTPVHLLAMRYDFVEDVEDLMGQIYEVLVDSGADPDLFYLGHNCLSLAVLRGNTRLIKRILDREDVDPNEPLGCGMGVPLTVPLLKRYKNVLPLWVAQEVLDALVEGGANPLNSVSPNMEINVLDFLELENRLEETGKKVKVNKKEPHFKLLQYLTKITQDCQDRRNGGKMVEWLYNYKILCSLSDPLLDRLSQMIDTDEAIRILKLFINFDHILVIPAALVDLLELIQMANAKSSPGTPKSSRKGSNKAKSARIDQNFNEVVENLLVDKIDIKTKYGNFPPEVDDDNEKYKVCYNCLKKIGKDLVLCPECELVYFCSQECNRINLRKPSGHRCRNLFYEEEKEKMEASRRKKSVIERLEEKRQRLLKAPGSSFNLKYYSSVHLLQELPTKVKFALPSLSRITFRPSKETKELLPTPPHLLDYKRRLSEVESDQRRLSKSGPRMSTRYSRVYEPRRNVLQDALLRRTSTPPLSIDISDVGRSPLGSPTSQDSKKSYRSLTMKEMQEGIKTSLGSALSQEENIKKRFGKLSSQGSRREDDTIIMKKLDELDCCKDPKEDSKFSKTKRKVIGATDDNSDDGRSILNQSSSLIYRSQDKSKRSYRSPQHSPDQSRSKFGYGSFGKTTSTWRNRFPGKDHRTQKGDTSGELGTLGTLVKDSSYGMEENSLGNVLPWKYGTGGKSGVSQKTDVRGRDMITHKGRRPGKGGIFEKDSGTATETTGIYGKVGTPGKSSTSGKYGASGKNDSFERDEAYNKDGSLEKDRSTGKYKTIGKTGAAGKDRLSWKGSTSGKYGASGKNDSFERDDGTGKNGLTGKYGTIGKDAAFGKNRSSIKAGTSGKDGSFGKEGPSSKEGSLRKSTKDISGKKTSSDKTTGKNRGSSNDWPITRGPGSPAKRSIFGRLGSVRKDGITRRTVSIRKSFRTSGDNENFPDKIKIGMEGLEHAKVGRPIWKPTPKVSSPKTNPKSVFEERFKKMEADRFTRKSLGRRVTITDNVPTYKQIPGLDKGDGSRRPSHIRKIQGRQDNRTSGDYYNTNEFPTSSFKSRRTSIGRSPRASTKFNTEKSPGASTRSSREKSPRGSRLSRESWGYGEKSTRFRPDTRDPRSYKSYRKSPRVRGDLTAEKNHGGKSKEGILKKGKSHTSSSPERSMINLEQKFKLGDKIPMTPRMLRALGSLLEDEGTALHSATLINGQLYYKFSKYKAYSNIGLHNNFSFQ